MKIRIISLALLLSQNIFAQYYKESPAWTKDLVIYEISTKNFTSPNGPESGTFNSLKEKVSYLHDLGVNGIWLTGNFWANGSHFYNIWTQYACIRPDSLDATLGTSEDFKAMIDEFHKYDIKVFLDAITHGVMNDSPLIKEHPEWFKGASWGMIDYDWFGNHSDLDEWWVKTHSDYVTKYGVDGFRLDLWMYRPELWNKIKENAVAVGHPIVVFQEAWDYNDSYSNGVNDFLQGLDKLSSRESGLNKESPFLYNVAGYYLQQINQDKLFEINKVIVQYTDSTEDVGYKNKAEGNLSFVAEKTGADKESNIRIKIDHINPAKAIKNISAIPLHHSFFPYSAGGISSTSLPNHNTGYISPAALTGLSSVAIEITPIVPDKLFYTTLLSCHDDGWEGFAANENPYAAEGSRCLFGYSSLFTPSIIVFMAGEEFNADFVPLPTLSPYLFEKKDIGNGKWLYGSWLQWDQLKEKKHREMLTDVKKMLAIRKQESDLLHAATNENTPNIDSLGYVSKTKLPTPYILWNDHKALFVAGNNTDKDVSLSVKIPLDKIGFEKTGKFIITDLWNGKKTEVTAAGLDSFPVKIKKDKTAGGGIAIYKIEISR
jgi:glycosidase